MKRKSINQCASIEMPINYFVLFAVNSLVLYFANQLFPNQIVLGNQSVSYGWAFIHSMGTLAILNIFLIPIVKEHENKIGKKTTNKCCKCWMTTYLLANFIGLWILARFANQLGMGLSSWVVVLLLALALSIVQRMVIMSIGKLKKK